VLKQFTKNLLKSALNEEDAEHLVHEKSRAKSDRDSDNARNGTGPKTVLTEASEHVQIEVPRGQGPGLSSCAAVSS
jgi:transposase-like protein